MKVIKFELRGADIDEVSSVDRAAQKPARAVLMKRDDALDVGDLDKFDPNEPRNESGEWESGGGGTGGSRSDQIRTARVADMQTRGTKVLQAAIVAINANYSSDKAFERVKAGRQHLIAARQSAGARDFKSARTSSRFAEHQFTAALRAEGSGIGASRLRDAISRSQEAASQFGSASRLHKSTDGSPDPMMTCPECGNKTPAGSTNCSICGEQMDPEDMMDGGADDAVEKFSPDQPRDESGKWASGSSSSDLKTNGKIAGAAYDKAKSALESHINNYTGNETHDKHIADAVHHFVGAARLASAAMNHISGAGNYDTAGAKDMNAQAKEFMRQHYQHMAAGMKSVRAAGAGLRIVKVENSFSDQPRDTSSLDGDLEKANQDGDDAMGDENKAELDALKKSNEALAKRLERSDAIAALSETDRAFFKSLSGGTAEAFLAMDGTARAGEIAKAAALNPVVFTSKAGVEFRKNDSPREIAMAKQLDSQAEEIAKARAANELHDLEKRAEEFDHLPGTVAETVAMLKAIDSMPDAAMKEKALEKLRAGNKAAGAAFSSRGSPVAPLAGSPADQLEQLSKAHAKTANVDLAKARAAILKTPEGKRLYNEAEIAKRSTATA